MKQIIIGLGYKAQSGKDTVAQILEKHYLFETFSFAGPLKAACREIFGFSEAQLYGDLKEASDRFWSNKWEEIVTPRLIMQKFGTEVMRNHVSQNIWIDALERAIQGHPRVVIPDVRFSNEAQAIKAWGGKLIRVDRPNRPKIKTGSHISEVELDDFRDWDYVVHNDREDDLWFDVLEDQVREIMTKILEPWPKSHPQR